MCKVLILLLILFVLVTGFNLNTPKSTLDTQLLKITQTHNLMGLQLQITNHSRILYDGNFGLRDNLNPITNTTMFRVASCSKSVVSAAVMLLVEEKKLGLDWAIEGILGYRVRNPDFGDRVITVEMVLSHQSGFVDCDPYYGDFLEDTDQAQSGYTTPHIKQILVQGGKYYNKCLFSNHPPGSHYKYTNLNYGIAGTIVQIISGTRFDIFVQERITKYISMGLPQVATFRTSTIRNPENLGTCFQSQDGKWMPGVDYYPDGKIPVRNMTGYVIGSNGAVFGPQGSMRASVSHLSNYITMLANGGVTKQGTRVLKAESVAEMLKPRYQFHGPQYGPQNYYHLYGLGLYTTSYLKNDNVFPHEVVRGHTGDAYGLKSAYYFWGNYTLTYIMNGALYGYQQNTETIYERERMLLCAAAIKFVNALKQERS